MGYEGTKCIVDSLSLGNSVQKLSISISPHWEDDYDVSGFVLLAPLTGLQELKIFDSEITRDMMETLQEFPRLRKVIFSRHNNTLGVQHMTSGITLLTALQILVFENCHEMDNERNRLTGSGGQPLANGQSMVKTTMVGLKVTGEHCCPVKCFHIVIQQQAVDIG